MARKYRTLQTRARKEKRTKRTKRTRKKQRGGTKEAKDFFRDLQKHKSEGSRSSNTMAPKDFFKKKDTKKLRHKVDAYQSKYVTEGGGGYKIRSKKKSRTMKKQRGGRKTKKKNQRGGKKCQTIEERLLKIEGILDEIVQSLNTDDSEIEVEPIIPEMNEIYSEAVIPHPPPEPTSYIQASQEREDEDLGAVMSQFDPSLHDEGDDVVPREVSITEDEPNPAPGKFIDPGQLDVPPLEGSPAPFDFDPVTKELQQSEYHPEASKTSYPVGAGEESDTEPVTPDLNGPLGLD